MFNAIEYESGWQRPVSATHGAASQAASGSEDYRAAPLTTQWAAGAAAVAIIFCAALLGVIAAPPAIASPRIWEPLVLKGTDLSALHDVPLDRVEVLAMHDGALAPIPFQIDPTLPNGSFLMWQGPHPSTGVKPTTVGPRDEMVMMMSDLGPRRSRTAKLPPGALEVTVTDLLGGPDLYAYIAAVSNPHRSPKRYVDYDPKLTQIETDHYLMRFENEFPDQLRLHNHKGEFARNLIDGFELQGSVALFGMLPIGLNQYDVDSSLLAYRAGPVRVIRRVGHRLRVFLGIRSPQVSTVEFFYRDLIQAPFTMRFPLYRLFRDIHGTIAMDFIDLRGFKLLASGLKAPIVIGNATAADGLDDWDTAPNGDWVALRGEGRLMLETFAPSPELAMIKRRVYYRGAPPPASEIGDSGPVAAAVGIQTRGWQKLDGGSHRFDPMIVDVPQSYGAARVIREATVPPIATVRPVSAAGHAAPTAGSAAPRAPRAALRRAGTARGPGGRRLRSDG